MNETTLDDLFKVLEWRNPFSIEVNRYRDGTIVAKTWKSWSFAGGVKILELSGNDIEDAIEEAKKQIAEIEKEEQSDTTSILS